MFFTVNLVFLDHLEDLTEVIDTLIDRNWMHEKQSLPISLKSFEINSSLLQAPKILKDYIRQYQEHNKKQHLHEQSDNTNCKFNTFISSFIVDIIGFSAALLTVLITLVIVYIISGHSKCKMLIANITLQCVKTVEAAALNLHNTICENGLIRILMILNLSIVTLMALAKLGKAEYLKADYCFTQSR